MRRGVEAVIWMLDDLMGVWWSRRYGERLWHRCAEDDPVPAWAEGALVAPLRSALLARWEGGLFRSATFVVKSDAEGLPLPFCEGELAVTPIMSACRDVTISGTARLSRGGGVIVTSEVKATMLGRRAVVDSYMTSHHDLLFDDDITPAEPEPEPERKPRSKLYKPRKRKAKP